MKCNYTRKWSIKGIYLYLLNIKNKVKQFWETADKNYRWNHALDCDINVTPSIEHAYDLREWSITVRHVKEVVILR